MEQFKVLKFEIINSVKQGGVILNKSEVAVLGHKYGEFQFFLNDKPIPEVQELNHLDHHVTTRHRDIFNCGAIISDLKLKSNVILTNF